MNLTVVRHGETEGNIAQIVQSRTDGSLTKRGLEQAAEAAKKLAGKSFDIIYCSNLGRCVQTASCIMSNHPNTPIIYDKRLIERGLGKYEGDSWENVPRLEHEGKNIEIPMPEGESWSDVYSRVAEFINDLYGQYPNKNILLVTHGGTMKAIKACLEGIPLHKAVADSVSKNGQILNWDVNRAVPVTYMR